MSRRARASSSAPDRFEWPAESLETTQLSVVDKERNAVALTYTLEAGYGSKIVVPEGYGLLLDIKDPANPYYHDKKLLAVIGKGAAQSWQMDNRGKTMIEGKFDFGWLKRVMDTLGKADIQVVLATPTAAPPVSTCTSPGGRCSTATRVTPFATCVFERRVTSARSS
mgnify:CR=1 FL=1